MNLIVTAGLAAAIGDIGRFSSPQKLVSYFGPLNPILRAVLPPRGAGDDPGGPATDLAGFAIGIGIGIPVYQKRLVRAPTVAKGLD